MSLPGNGGQQYLTGETARDVSRITGLPWRYCRVETNGPRVPYLGYSDYDEWDQFRIGWALVGGHHVIKVLST